MTKTVTVIIPSRNLEYLKSCVFSILQMKTNISYDILVIHNGYNEGITSFIEEQKLNQFIFNEKFNYSKANNRAAETVKTEYILFLNDDTEIINNFWLDQMVASYHEGIGAIGAVLLYSHGGIQSAGDSVGLEKYWHGRVLAFNNKTIISCTHPYQVDSITGACLLIKKSVFINAGLFDVQFELDYGDVDFGLHLLKMGYTNIVVPTVHIYHKEFGTRQQINNGSTYLLDVKWRGFVFWYKLKMKIKIVLKKIQHSTITENLM